MSNETNKLFQLKNAKVLETVKDYNTACDFVVDNLSSIFEDIPTLVKVFDNLVSILNCVVKYQAFQYHSTLRLILKQYNLEMSKLLKNDFKSPIECNARLFILMNCLELIVNKKY